MRRLSGAAYRLLVLLALRYAQAPLSKGELAWQVRANHPTITRVLNDLRDDDLIQVDAQPDGSFAIAATPRGLSLLERNAPALPDLFGAPVEEHFRYGPRPAWLPQTS